MATRWPASDDQTAVVERLRRAWLPVRRRLIPDDTRRDRVYRELRHLARAVRSRLTRDPMQAEYDLFQKTFEPSPAEIDRQRREACDWPDPPVFSIATAVFAPGLATFTQTLDAVRAQTYPHWRWHVVDASPGDRIWRVLTATARADPRIRPIRLGANRGIAGNVNVALGAADGDYVALLDHDDTLAPFALCAMARAIGEHPEADVLYSDSDKLDARGRRCEPFFKPDWSPELLLGCNYLNQLTVIRRSLLDEIGPLDPGLDGADDWDLYLRLAERTQAFVHVPQVLYHWRKTWRSTADSIDRKPGVRRAQARAIAAHLERRGLVGVRVEFDRRDPIRSHYPRLTWASSRTRRVSVIIPVLDHAPRLTTCLEGIFDRTAHADVEVVLVDSGSAGLAIDEWYRPRGERPGLTIVRLREAGNVSRSCNAGVRHASGELILLASHAIEVLHADWLARLVQWLDVPGVGIVGPKILRPDGRVHHGGVIMGVGGLASSLFVGEREGADSVFGPEGWYRNLSGVSGACLLTSRALYEQLGGLDERFSIKYSDVDFCLRAIAARYRIVFTPDARLRHHPSPTDPRTVSRTDLLEAVRHFQPMLQRSDPFFNLNLSCRSGRPRLRLEPTDTPRHAHDELLRRLGNTAGLTPLEDFL
jgi:GT2 family glycosyltransferase